MFTMRVDTSNAAFEDEDGPYELSRILKVVALAVESGSTHGKCRDTNGNRVGEWSLDESEE